MNTQSTASTVVRGLLGCGGLMLAFFTVAAVVALVKPTKPADAPISARATDAERSVNQPTRIDAGINEFQTALAALPGEMTKKAADNGVRYSWKSVSNSTNWAQFWDEGDNGTIEQVMIGVAIPLNDDAQILEALATAHVIVETASGVAVHGPTFTEWVRQSIGASESQSRRFGSATVSVSAMGARDGAVLLFGIGGEKSK